MDKLKLERLNKIAVLGPHDRINFGDFLFPIMLDFALSKTFNSKIELKKFSLVKADFSHLGAFSSNSYKVLTKSINNNEIDTVIVAGGESLTARWNNLYSYINPYYDKLYQNTNLRNNRLVRNIPKFILGNKTEFPFIINNLNYTKKNIRHYYNAVGGASGLNKNQINVLKSANLVGLRDLASFEYLEKNNLKENIFLVPDSAIILSDVYPINELPINNFGEYIFLQLSNYKHENKIDDIISQLEKLLSEGNKIILCPIGTAKGHEDHIILKKIKENISRDNLILVEGQPTIKEIISYIVNSKLYIGTSLHGVITAMSYAVPYIALNPKQSKLTSFLKTWSIPELNLAGELDSFYSKINQIDFENIKSEIFENTKTLKNKYYQFINTIAKEL